MVGQLPPGWEVDEWQERWSNATKGLWTKKLIPNVSRWICRKHGRLTYWLTQALTGHGCFRDYLHRMGKIEDGSCPTCHVPETAEHVIVFCPRMEVDREVLRQERQLPRPITPEALGELLLESSTGWTAASTFLTAVVKKLETEERARNEAHE